MISDLMIGDTSSILGEFCALDKPLITFEIPLVGRMTEETKTMLEDISFRVKNFDELIKTIPIALKNKNLHQKARKKYNKIMFDQLDGKASERAVRIIKEVVREYK
jgi:CDP-glycerol glycerophosphotransferase (TagB/SpsB family)